MNFAPKLGDAGTAGPLRLIEKLQRPFNGDLCALFS
jgi:hypothetical protein